MLAGKLLMILAPKNSIFKKIGMKCYRDDGNLRKYLINEEPIS